MATTAYSPSCSPPTSPKPVELLARIATDEQRERVYAERSCAFRGSFTQEQYLNKQRALDKYSINRSRKTLWILVSSDAIGTDWRAALEVYTRDIHLKKPGSDQIELRQAAYLATLFVPLRWRGHGYARLVIRKVLSVIQTQLLPWPLNDVAIVYGTAEVGMEAIYRGVTWQNFARATWSSLSDAPVFAASRTTESIYDYEVDSLIDLATARATATLSRSERAPAFVVLPSAAQVRVRMANYRLTWRILRPNEPFPTVVGARIGDVDDPATCSFAIWGFRAAANGIRIWMLSTVNSAARLALCEAATTAARELGGDNVCVVLDDPDDPIKALVGFKSTPSIYDYSEGAMLLDSDAACHWLHRNEFDFPPAGGP